jgi:predicted transcriptional regulator
MGKKQSAAPLGHRERQIIDTVYKLGEASVSDVLNELPDPPSYSSVRKMLSLLEVKGLLRHREERTKYVYRPTLPVQSASRAAVKHLMATFFSGSATETVNAILDVSSRKLNEDDFDRLLQIIENARREGQ